MQRLERFVRELIEADAIHRDGTHVKSASWSTLFEHLDRELVELKDAIAANSRSDIRGELGDVLGIIVHAIVKAGFTTAQIEVAELWKLAERFKLPDGSQPLIPWVSNIEGASRAAGNAADTKPA